uniref:Transmembrane protein n=1 Tax=Eucampia antarctica TaxID=49252 RepID=A0A6U0QB52_9STRA|eukprot:CAMPEP_0197827562 /NCGR_PEP_ID=MMETSP1437-20131217/4305_1 /TAXON_ID=49252 ORGANISM="Eucampia antarctica, Strain CCMP1452" /NCGR_SAMPLE_ID=MMETSP1437 /ASSEMBLY_ACC=CAM_ASM_001096 /LENGTH=189 /DNA_ID=CAMNT_0043428437 /DNA_START=55 /DNA_END=624 /DNA_ORIENTATION=+
MTATVPMSRTSDEESAQFLRNRGTRRKKGDDPFPNIPPSTALPARHPVNILKRLTYISCSSYVLHLMGLWYEVIHGPDVNHLWFQIGMAISVAIQAVKTYLEMYEGRYKKRRVDYENCRTATHIIMFLIILATLVFHAALWPAYGGAKTMFIMGVFGFGILIPIMLVIPTWIQNPLAIILMTFFIQQYQ